MLASSVAFISWASVSSNPGSVAAAKAVEIDRGALF